MIGDDLTPFFVAGEFARVDDQLGGIAVQGIFDDNYVRSCAGYGMGSSSPAYHLATTAVPADLSGLVLTHKGRSYRVVEPESDGTGVTVLILEYAL